MDRKKLVFLLVDDNFMMIKMMIPMLEGLGYHHFITAADGVQAWDKLNGEGEIHIILSDLIMPNMDGLEFLQKVRESENFWDVPFVMVTGEEHQNQLMSSIETEVNAYILKPFTPDKLEKEINAVLREKYDPPPFYQAIQKGRELLFQQDQPEAAEQFFKMAAKLQPLEADPCYFLAIICNGRDEIAEAKQYLKKCISLRESYTKAYDLLALVYRREKKFDKEKKVLEVVTELSPDNLERVLNLGVVCANLGEQDSVKKFLGMAAKLARKSDKSIYETIFRTYLMHNELAEDAENVFRKYIDPYFDTPRLINKYALILKEYKAYDSAIYFFKKIVNTWRTVKNHEIAPEEMAVYYFNLSVAYSEKANLSTQSEKDRKATFKKADNFVNKALDCNPNHRDAMKLLSWLEKRVA